MGGLKTLFLTLALLMPAQVFAMAERDDSDLVQVFAVCLGRYSAQMEDAWNAYSTDDPSEARRSAFLTLLDAVRPASDLSGPQILQMRLEAKWAHARLLSIARFHTDPAQSRRARAQANIALRPCEALLL